MIYLVINLKRRPDRLERFDKLVSGQISYSVVQGVDVAGLKQSNFERNGQVGCRLSHRTCFAIANAFKEDVFVFEDDVDINCSWSEFFYLLHNVPADYDIVSFGFQLQERNVIDYNENFNKYVSGEVWGAHAYLVNWKIASRLMELNDDWKSGVVNDEYIYSNKFNCYLTKVSKFKQYEDYSDIHNQIVKPKGLY